MKELDEALPIIKKMLDRGDFLQLEYNLYLFLRICNQKNPYVLKCFTQLCQRVAKSSEEDIGKIGRKEVSELAPKYLNKLQVVLRSNDLEIMEKTTIKNELTAE